MPNTTWNQWSSNAGSNTPQGNEFIDHYLDDHLRNIKAQVKANAVDLGSTQTITGDKTFSGQVTMVDLEVTGSLAAAALIASDGSVQTCSADNLIVSSGLTAAFMDTAGYLKNNASGAITGGNKVSLVLPHTWTVPGEIAVAEGDSNYLVPFFVPVPAGQTVTLVKARHRINSGTSVVVSLKKNGSYISDWQNITVTTTSTTTDQTDVSFSDGDLLQLVVESVSGSPQNLTFTVYLKYEV